MATILAPVNQPEETQQQQAQTQAAAKTRTVQQQEAKTQEFQAQTKKLLEIKAKLATLSDTEYQQEMAGPEALNQRHNHQKHLDAKPEKTWFGFVTPEARKIWDEKHAEATTFRETLEAVKQARAKQALPVNPNADAKQQSPKAPTPAVVSSTTTLAAAASTTTAPAPTAAGSTTTAPAAAAASTTTAPAPTAAGSTTTQVAVSATVTTPAPAPAASPTPAPAAPTSTAASATATHTTGPSVAPAVVPTTNAGTSTSSPKGTSPTAVVTSPKAAAPAAQPAKPNETQQWLKANVFKALAENDDKLATLSGQLSVLANITDKSELFNSVPADKKAKLIADLLALAPKVQPLLAQIDVLRKRGAKTAELEAALDNTVQFLTGTMPANVYHDNAQKAIRSNNRTSLQVLGGIMLGIALTAVALGIVFFPPLAAVAAAYIAADAVATAVGLGVVTGVGAAAGSFGLFGYGQKEGKKLQQAQENLIAVPTAPTPAVPAGM